MHWIRTFRERAKWIKVDARMLAGKHGEGAYDVAREMERQANSLSAFLYWRAVGKALSGTVRSEDGVDNLAPAHGNNCISCLVDRIAGTHDNEGPHMPFACISCVAHRLGVGADRLSVEAEDDRDGIPADCAPAIRE
jgi:hypothetical protein